MSAHTIGTCYENPSIPGGNGEKFVTGSFTGTASYDSGGSTLDLSSIFADECRGAWIFDKTGEFQGIYLPTASTNAAATGKVMIRGISWDDVALTHGSTCFNAAATTDNDVIWQQPALSEVVGVKITLTERFVASSMTALTVEIGDSGDHNGLYAGAADLVADAVNSTSTTWGAEIGDWTNAYAATATDRYLYATATGANLNTLTAGECTVRMYFVPQDNLTKTSGKYGNPEVHSGQVLSAYTFNFIAWGTDA